MSYKHPIELGVEKLGLDSIATILEITPQALEQILEENTLEEYLAGNGLFVHSYGEVVKAVKSKRTLDGRRLPSIFNLPKSENLIDPTVPHFCKETKQWRWLTDEGDVDYNDLRNVTVYKGRKPGVPKSEREAPHVEWCAACGFILEMPDEAPVPCPYPVWSKKYRSIEND